MSDRTKPPRRWITTKSGKKYYGEYIAGGFLADGGELVLTEDIVESDQGQPRDG